MKNQKGNFIQHFSTTSCLGMIILHWALYPLKKTFINSGKSLKNHFTNTRREQLYRAHTSLDLYHKSFYIRPIFPGKARSLPLEWGLRSSTWVEPCPHISHLEVTLAYQDIYKNYDCKKIMAQGSDVTLRRKISRIQYYKTFLAWI